MGQTVATFASTPPDESVQSQLVPNAPLLPGEPEQRFIPGATPVK